MSKRKQSDVTKKEDRSSSKEKKRPSEDEWSWKHLPVNQRESKLRRPFRSLSWRD
jgi:hypothetical protein